ncbi:hypothetical protein EUTSA_v10015377mg [Eutrema salsugineum]|uniref:F-box associated beta-propeller type 1 domain-containing protein n=1 Tax=Eutrema salsugineum TaxID=72664 RepID=V4LMC8_EUTSA|nr:hypothetical protein EUTSA_v10015377mg [Eutrema salsugineum]
MRSDLPQELLEEILSKVPATLVVWNPCLGETRWIQPRIGFTSFSRFSLGYQNNNKFCRSYKILRCWCREPNNRFEIYELSSDSWRVLDEISLDFYISPNGVSLKGNTFWITWDGNLYNRYVHRFDFTTERFQQLSLPKKMQLRNTERYIRGHSVFGEEKLSVFYQCLVSREMEIWVTNKIGTEAAELSWSNFVTLELQRFCRLIKVVLYCSESYNMVYTIGEHDEYYTEVPFIESTNESSWLDDPFAESIYIKDGSHLSSVMFQFTSSKIEAKENNR